MSQEIVVTSHALDQALARCPALADLGPAGAQRQVKAEVLEALEEGRSSSRKPAWIGFLPPGLRRRDEPGRRFVWPASGQRVFVVNVNGRGGAVVVITTLVPSWLPQGPSREVAA